ncbi:MAG: amino acid ABC transporter permease [Fusobacteriaceae bacterium]|nr:amino acid ABC transporter permease [Fusobacteriaceae bacterium]MBN2838938.1 amino acid ABC transporter permease [Fusobacteriaceae bacterium]
MEQQFLNFEFMGRAIFEIIKFIPVTLNITVVSIIFAFIIALTTALIRINKIPFLNGIVKFYVSFTRGTPLLVQIYLSYYGLPKFLDYINMRYNKEIDIAAVPAILFVYIAFSFNVGAYLSETFRAAILSVEKGQIEGALSLGMTKFQSMIRIVLPQAFVYALPNLGNTIISLIKDTSLAFIISVVEMMGQAKIIGAQGLNFFEVYIVVAFLYWIICILVEKIVSILENRLRKFEGGKN